MKIIEGSNVARCIANKSDINEWIIEKVVTKIGEKFITVIDVDDVRYGEEKFDIQNEFRHVYTCGSQDYKLYLSREAIIENIEAENLYREVKNKFSDYRNKRKFSLDELKKVKEILG